MFKKTLIEKNFIDNYFIISLDRELVFVSRNTAHMKHASFKRVVSVYRNKEIPNSNVLITISDVPCIADLNTKQISEVLDVDEDFAGKVKRRANKNRDKAYKDIKSFIKVHKSDYSWDIEYVSISINHGDMKKWENSTTLIKVLEECLLEDLFEEIDFTKIA